MYTTPFGRAGRSEGIVGGGVCEPLCTGARCALGEVVLVDVRGLVEEEQVRVRRERPEVRRAQALGGVAHLSDVDHGFQAQRAREVRLRLARRGMDFLYGLAQRVERGLEGRDLGQLAALAEGRTCLL